LENLLTIAGDFAAKYNVPVAVNEYGAERWEPGAADYVRDEMAIFNQYGWNYAAWQWFASWPLLAESDNSFNFRFGPDPKNLTDIENALLSAYTAAWARNTVRPSNFAK
jgi:hypothetical protein